MHRPQWLAITRMALLFGLFQALMPLIGWACTSFFSSYIEAYDHWIAFGMLAFIGLKMIRDAFGGGEEQHFNPSKLMTQLMLAIATSIDALAVGISLACTGYAGIASLLWPLLAIGLTSVAFSLAGSMIGLKFGDNVARRLKPELLGGIILLIIAFKVLLEHVMQ